MTATPLAALRFWARERPNRIALEVEGERLTYAELVQAVGVASARMAADGVEAGDPVGIVGGDSIEFVSYVLGALTLAAVVIPFNFRFTVDEMVGLIVASGAGRVYVDPEYHERMLTVRDVLGDVVLADILLDDSAEDALFPTVGVFGDDPAIVVYTSGTTGRPKGVVYTHNMINMIAFQWSLIEPIPSADLRVLFVLPLSGIGTPWTLMQVLTRGGTLTLTRRFDPARTLDLLVEREINWFTGVPTIFAEVAKSSRVFRCVPTH